MMRSSRSSWLVRDRYGSRWRLTLRSPSLAAGVGSRDQLQSWIRNERLDGDLRSAGLMDPSAALREAYACLDGFAPAPRHQHDGARAADLRTIRARLLFAAEAGRLCLERAEPVAWHAPAAELAAPPASEGPSGPTTTHLAVRLVDEVGDGIANVALLFRADGATQSIPTDASGLARLDGLKSTHGSCTLGSVAAVRLALAERWARPRPAALPQGPDVVVRELSDELVDAVPVRAEVLTTIVVTPYFECHEVPGAHFDLGRSFVLPDAFSVLSRIAALLSREVNRKAMLFGHTDRIGSESLNKSLSEKRARALYALLTHDAETWEWMWSGKDGDAHWTEQWGTRQSKEMLNALRCTDAAGRSLDPSAGEDAAYRSAVERFQSGEYPEPLATREPLSVDGIAGPLTRREMFLGYAALIASDPVSPDRFARFGPAAYMGCGEYNPLHDSAQDAESRRAIVFVFDSAAEPSALPCRVGSIEPCTALVKVGRTNDDDAPASATEPPYRCPVYRRIAQKCPCNGGLPAAPEPLTVSVYVADFSDPGQLVVLDGAGATHSVTELATSQRHDATYHVAFDPSELPALALFVHRRQGLDTTILGPMVPAALVAALNGDSGDTRDAAAQWA